MGPIPTQLARCKALKKLDLSDNLISGPLPVGLMGSWGFNLTELRVQDNLLTGTISTVFNSPSRLAALYLGENYFCPVSDYTEFANSTDHASSYTDYTCPCDPDPCQNGGYCATFGLNYNHTCYCLPGFSGSECETNID
jgi:hypothetical protein